MRKFAISLFGVVLVMLLAAGSASAASGAPQDWTDMIEYDELGDVSVGSPLSYSHQFTPPTLSPSDSVIVNRVQLKILLTDDWACVEWTACRNDLRSEGEWAVIEIEGTEIFDGVIGNDWIPATLVFRDVTLLANVEAYGDSFGVTIQSTGGDFAVVFSAAKFTYTTDDGASTSGGGASVPMPEPTSALVFGVGLLVVSRRLRRRA